MHAWDLIKLEEDDLGIKFVAERPYTGHAGEGAYLVRSWWKNIDYDVGRNNRDWQANLNESQHNYKMIRMGFIEEGETAVMTPAYEFDIYNDKSADF